MKAIQITMEESLLKAVDRRLRGRRHRRSAFIRDSVRQQLERLRLRDLEEQHRSGYEKQPEKKGEFDVWYRTQEWGEE